MPNKYCSPYWDEGKNIYFFDIFIPESLKAWCISKILRGIERETGQKRRVGDFFPE